MKKIETDLLDCYILEPDRFGDARGYFSPYFIDKNLEELGFHKVVQASRSKSSKGVIRGLHFQKNPKCQAKIVEVIKGSAIDVVVDMRRDSPSYGKHVAVKLTDDNNRQLFVPRGFAHGFLSLEDGTIFQYLMDNDYSPKMEGGILWNDPDLNIDWERMLRENGIDQPILSDKDLVHPCLKECQVVFKREQEKFLITGVSGQLGYDVKRELLKNGIDHQHILALNKEKMDITDAETVMKIVTEFHPDVIFHCAAWTAVDKAETMEEDAFLVNVVGSKNIVEAAKAVGAKLVYLSTDYVFDGKKEGIYEPEDSACPLNVYGKTKYLGEEEIRKYEKHFIVRTSWVFGINGYNFIKTMLKLSETHEDLNVVNDQIGSPTYTVDLAHLLVQLAQTDLFGTYHGTTEEYCSWAELAEYVFSLAKKKVKVNQVSTEEYLTLANISQASRPTNSRLDKLKLETIGINRLPTWKNAVERFCNELGVL